MKIVVLDGYAENPGDLSWEGFKKFGDVTVYDRTPVGDVDEIIQRIGDAQIIITNKTPIGEEVLAACPAVKYIGVLATGYNVIDVAAATKRQIPVTNIPSYGTDTVSQFAIAMLLEICHHIGHHDAAVKAGRWAKSPDFCFWDYPQIELAGKTIGILGFGRIGLRTGEIAKALGMKVLAWDAYPTQKGAAIAEYVTKDALFAAADVIAVHCPLFPETEGIINAESIAKMKDGVIIINNSRGPLVIEQDLADALNCGKVKGAALDVVSVEPIRDDNPLLTAKNCFITPHIAWASNEARERIMNTAVGNLEAFLAGETVNVVNFK